MNVIITGGYGFIGTYLYNLLPPVGLKIARSKRLEPFGIYNRKICEPPYNNNTPLDIIYHLAAYSRVQYSNDCPDLVFENSIVSLQQSLELARLKKAKLVFTSTSYCNVNKDANYYAFAKDIGEQLCQFYHKTYGVDVVICRLFNVYGNEIRDYPEWKLGVVDKFLLDKKLGRPYVINNSGEQRRDYIHIRDVVEALSILGFNKTDPNIVYEIGTGETYSVNEIAKMIFGDKPGSKHLVNGEILNSQSLGGIEFTKNLGWEPKINLEKFLKNR